MNISEGSKETDDSNQVGLLCKEFGLSSFGEGRRLIAKMGYEKAKKYLEIRQTMKVYKSKDSKDS